MLPFRPPTLYVPLSVAYASNPKVIEAGERAELLYVRGLLHCREHLTDGVIDRRLLSRVAFGISGKPLAHAARLVAVELWLEDPAGWRVPEPTWRAWNPTAGEVATRRERNAGSLGNHKRWHGPDRYDPSCSHCVASSHADRTCDDDAIRTVSPKTQPKTKTSLSRGARDERAETVDQALVLLAEADLESASNVRNRRAFLAAATRTRRDEHLEQLTELADRHPEWSAEALRDSARLGTTVAAPRRSGPCDACGNQWEASDHALRHAEHLAGINRDGERAAS
jgi:hypothetical protein